MFLFLKILITFILVHVCVSVCVLPSCWPLFFLNVEREFAGPCRSVCGTAGLKFLYYKSSLFLVLLASVDATCTG